MLANRVTNVSNTRVTTGGHFMKTLAGIDWRLLYKTALKPFFETNMTVQYSTLFVLKQQIGHWGRANGLSKWRAHSTLSIDVYWFPIFNLYWDSFTFPWEHWKSHKCFGAIISHCRCCSYKRRRPIGPKMSVVPFQRVPVILRPLWPKSNVVYYTKLRGQVSLKRTWRCRIPHSSP